MNSESSVTVQVARRMNDSPENTFDAWLDPRTVGRWLFATSTGEMVRVDIDARVGGQFVLVDRRDGEDIEHTGEYLEISRPRRLQFTFAVPKYSPKSTLVTVDITPLLTGCGVTLTHEGVLAEYAVPTREGWIAILANLDAMLSVGS